MVSGDLSLTTLGSGAPRRHSPHAAGTQHRRDAQRPRRWPPEARPPTPAPLSSSTRPSWTTNPRNGQPPGKCQLHKPHHITTPQLGVRHPRGECQFSNLGGGIHPPSTPVIHPGQITPLEENSHSGLIGRSLGEESSHAKGLTKSLIPPGLWSRASCRAERQTRVMKGERKRMIEKQKKRVFFLCGVFFLALLAKMLWGYFVPPPHPLSAVTPGEPWGNM